MEERDREYMSSFYEEEIKKWQLINYSETEDELAYNIEKISGDNGTIAHRRGFANASYIALAARAYIQTGENVTMLTRNYGIRYKAMALRQANLERKKQEDEKIF